MNTQAGARLRIRRRPALVWLVSSFCISAGLWAMLVLYLISIGEHPLPESKLAYFANYSSADFWPLMFVQFLNVVAGVLLLLLRREAVYMFAIKFAAAVGVAVWNALEKGSMDTSEIGNIIIGLLLWGASAAVVFYAWYLKQKGVLK